MNRPFAIIVVCLFVVLSSQCARAESFVYPVGDKDQAPVARRSDCPSTPTGTFRVSQTFDTDAQHTGVDLCQCGLRCTEGSEVRAIGHGTVVMTNTCGDPTGACVHGKNFGNAVLVRHSLPGGTFYSLYAHMQAGSLKVLDNAPVEAGTPLGNVGSTGFSEAPHLHFAVKRTATFGCGYIDTASCGRCSKRTIKCKGDADCGRRCANNPAKPCTTNTGCPGSSCVDFGTCTAFGDLLTNYLPPLKFVEDRVSRVYDVAADFSATSNPNGPWSYGASAALGSIKLFTTPSNPSQAGDHFVAGLDSWHNAPGIAEAYGAPLIIHNGSGGVVTDAATGLSWQPGQLTCHPAPNGQFCVIRWAAPVAGNYSIDAVFTGADPHGTTTDVHVLKGGTELSSGFVNGQNHVAVGFDASFAVGGTLDFAVGWGSNSTFFYDTTFVNAVIAPLSGSFTITHNPLPEPDPNGPDAPNCHANNPNCSRPHFFRDINIGSDFSTNTLLTVNAVGGFTEPVIITVDKIDRDDLKNTTNCPVTTPPAPAIAVPCANGIGDAIDNGNAYPNGVAIPNPGVASSGFFYYFNGDFAQTTATVTPGNTVQFNAYRTDARSGRYIIYLKGTSTVTQRTFINQLLLVVGGGGPIFSEQ